ncbi:MAG: transposase [Peptococcaceae bacterium]
MARRNRIEFPGALFHVICRGNNGENILKSEADKLEYLELVRKYKIRYKFNLFAYCIMDNHVHLLVETGEVPLAKIMQGIQQSFTQRYNKKYRRTGHVFQQRYKAQLCDKENYLLHLIKYIHNNPLKAGIGKLNYRWSSHNNYTKGHSNQLVEVDFVLKTLAEDPARAIKMYQEYMEIEDPATGVEQYKLETENLACPDKERKNLIEKIESDYIIECVCKIAGVKKEEISKRSKLQKYSDIRKVIVLLCNRYSRMSGTALAGALNIPLSMVSKIKSGESKLSPAAEELLKKVENKGIFQA